MREPKKNRALPAPQAAVLLLIAGIIQLIMSVTVLGLMIALLNEISKGDCDDGQCDESSAIVVLVFGVILCQSTNSLY